MASEARTVRAAGGVVWRRRRGKIEVLLVHRPRYDDWSFPKGKARRGESDTQTALREVVEETGQRCRLGPRVGEQHYEAKGRPKTVVYFLMEAGGGRFDPGDEVDDVAWVPAEEGEARLTYEIDRETLADALRLLDEQET
jgi:8-oxo-dGTP diphosphatase